ncbi:MAG: hypothetical protein R2800_07815 [Flavipsychrobacter sp.]
MKKLFLFLCVLGLASCYYDNEEELYPSTGVGGGCDTTNVGYAAVIQPIFNQYCAVSGCHDKTTRSSNYDFSSYSGAMTSVNNNRLLGTIMHQAGFSQMPQGMSKLDDCTIAKIKAWVNAGAKND